MNSIKDLKPTAIWQNFYKLTQVPRPSNHEEQARKFTLPCGGNSGSLNIRANKYFHDMIPPFPLSYCNLPASARGPYNFFLGQNTLPLKGSPQLNPLFYKLFS